MKVYVVVVEASTSRGNETKVSETGHPVIETAKIELVEQINGIKANPKSCFGYDRPEDLKTEWITDRFCVLKDTFSGDLVNIYIHEINVMEP